MLLILDETHKQHLEFLKNADTKVVKEFCRIAVENLQKGSTPKIFQTAAQRLEVDVEVVQNAAAGVSYLFTEATKMKMDELEFRDSILVLGFSEQSQQEITQFYLDNEAKIRSLLSSFDLAIPYYRNLHWRLDATIASRSYSAPTEPLFELSLELEQDGQQSSVYLQTDPVNLIHMTDVLDQALQEARSLHARRIMRNVK